MTWFAQRVLAEEHLDADPDVVQGVLVDPDALARLTPLVARIEVGRVEDGGGDVGQDAEGGGDGARAAVERWTWQLVGISAVGVRAAPRFTTLMAVRPGEVRFRPDPSRTGRSAAEGRIIVAPDDRGWAAVHLDLTARVELPLPRMAGRAVRRAMWETMRAGGARFADALVADLGGVDRVGLQVTRSGGTAARSAG